MSLPLSHFVSPRFGYIALFENHTKKYSSRVYSLSVTYVLQRSRDFGLVIQEHCAINLTTVLHKQMIRWDRNDGH